MKSILSILLGFTFVLSLGGSIGAAENLDSGLVEENVWHKRDPSLQQGNDPPPSAGAIALDRGQIEQVSLVLEGTQAAGFIPDSERKDQVSKYVNQEKSGFSDSDSTAYYLAGIALISFVGLARRGILSLFNYKW